MVLWIRTARDAGYSSVGEKAWLPSSSDITKSALFERIRSGKAPLKYPPPRGLACPWYAVVEDEGPHYVFEVRTEMPEHWKKDAEAAGITDEHVIVLQNAYVIEKKRGPKDFIVRDGHHGIDTGYRFRLWHDPDWKHPSGYQMNNEPGGWFIQHVDFAKNAPDWAPLKTTPSQP